MRAASGRRHSVFEAVNKSQDDPDDRPGQNSIFRQSQCGQGSLHRARDIREYGIRITADQADGTDHDDQNYGHHNRVFRDILTGFL
jgi:hypothetical protein